MSRCRPILRLPNLDSPLIAVVAGGESEPHQAVRRKQSHCRVLTPQPALQAGPLRLHPESRGEAHRAVQPEEDQACGGFFMGPGGGKQETFLVYF